MPVVVVMTTVMVAMMAGNVSALGAMMMMVTVTMRNLPISLAADNTVNNVCDHLLDVLISPAVIAPTPTAAAAAVMVMVMTTVVVMVVMAVMARVGFVPVAATSV